MDHCEMSARGRDMLPQSRGVMCIYSPDVAVHRLCPRELPFHLQQLPASRVLAEASLFKLKCTMNVAAPAGLRAGRTPAHVWSAAHS